MPEEVLIDLILKAKKVDFKVITDAIADMTNPLLGSEWTLVVPHDLG